MRKRTKEEKITLYNVKWNYFAMFPLDAEPLRPPDNFFRFFSPFVTHCSVE